MRGRKVALTGEETCRTARWPARRDGSGAREAADRPDSPGREAGTASTDSEQKRDVVTLDTNAAGSGTPRQPPRDGSPPSGTAWFATPRPTTAAGVAPTPAGSANTSAAGSDDATPPATASGRARVPAGRASVPAVDPTRTPVPADAAARPASGRASVPTGPISMPPPSRPRGPIAQAAARHFWVLGDTHPQIRLRKLAGVVVWGALLGLGGLVAGAPVVLGLFTSTPTWYVPTLCAIGLMGLACTAAAFASVHRERLPWVMLSIATVTLIVAFVVN